VALYAQDIAKAGCPGMHSCDALIQSKWGTLEDAALMLALSRETEPTGQWIFCTQSDIRMSKVVPPESPPPGLAPRRPQVQMHEVTKSEEANSAIQQMLATMETEIKAELPQRFANAATN